MPIILIRHKIGKSNRKSSDFISNKNVSHFESFSKKTDLKILERRNSHKIVNHQILR
ncbi:hypothetical protein LEP1GSC041_3272 [Leptospira noguchii str. 2006001870]|uniref:Uncharacterized protein n=1 Tax=Leptospira noguchii serovar Autumnalis str. ZUN142 TaxID=1085540 RepID=M6UMT2_9LEPT|nr:hypothetical protein LEP1GSC041_3272 [Leptospira noguchii str. 2006001870]EMI69686.1 hypothetical protein LEP1GSC072_4180 [Leptospira noguchii str. Bonito]EMO42369.1 hypothetical protein LEP1GSC186_4584 [Leptospira noguchii serovar Autumnalis str. ZUN142]